jgi:polygalacturonase
MSATLYIGHQDFQEDLSQPGPPGQGSMSVRRREFLRSGLGLAALVTAGSGCERLMLREPAEAAGSWNEVPGILARIVPPQFPERDFVVTDYGAVADAKVDCYPAFAAAIAACHKAGGGRVVAPAARGPYLVNGPIHLKSNVNLYLEAGSTVRFGTNPSDYLPVVQIRYQGIRCYNYSPLIYAFQQTNIAITGSGVFEGQAYSWDSWIDLANADWALLEQMVADGVPVEKRIFGAGHHLRLTMFEPYQCQNILVEGVTFTESPFWTIHPTFCSNVTIRNVTVLAGQENDDGCDPDSCTDVLVEGCSFTTNDDNVSIKAGYGKDSQGLAPTQNIVIQNCIAAGSDWGGITIGSDTGSVVKNVFVQNCKVGRCDNAFYIKSSSAVGGAVENVFIRSCQAAGCNVFLYLQTNYAFGFGESPPLFTNIFLENVSCDEVKQIAFALQGDERNPILYVALSDIAIGSAGVAQQVANALFVSSSNVTVGGQQVSISGLL